MNRVNFGLGWRKHTDEQHEAIEKLSVEHFTSLHQPSPGCNYDQRSVWQPVYNQETEGCCTAEGGNGVTEFALLQANYKWDKFTPSEAFTYFNTRQLAGDDVTTDCGGTISGVIAAIAKYGVCPKDSNPAWNMPYVPGNFAQAPSEANYKDGALHLALKYQSVPQKEPIISTLVANNIPVVFGFNVYSSFMTDEVAADGIMPVPGIFEALEGGHCVIRVGSLYNCPMGKQGITNWAICRNSWGNAWGDKGYFYMPLKEVFLNPLVASDFGAITQVGAA